MSDPRLSVIQERLASVRRMVGVTGGKGGVGKTLLATTTALLLAREGLRVGLFDLDFAGPSSHVILGIEPALPREERGIVPPEVDGVAYLSIAQFAKGSLAPLRGEDQQNILLELLAIAQWGTLDLLVFDMPPGLSDLCLDAFRWLPRTEYLVPTTASPLALAVAERLLRLLKEQHLPLLGVVENLAWRESSHVAQLAERIGAPFLGVIHWDRTVEETLGHPERLIATPLAEELRKTILPVLVSR
ncbi:MAG: ATP-binding protein [Candidatus Poribacteria bacterium]|nr:MAG: ATP-binding protein [Candidatus Poribacteria bacterium]